MRFTVTHQCMSGDVVDIQFAITHMVYLRVSNKTGTWWEEVSTLPLGSNIGRDGIDTIMGHEVVNVQVAHLNVCIITHSGGMERALGLDHSPTLTSCDVGKVLLSISLHTSLSWQRWNTIGALHVSWQHGHHKAHILGTGIELHIRTQLFGSIKVGSKTRSCGMEGCRQRYFQIVEVHMLHIPFQQTTDGKRIFRPTLTHSGRQIAKEQHDVLFTYRSVHLQPHLTQINRFHQRQWHVEFHIDIAIWCRQPELG